MSGPRRFLESKLGIAAATAVLTALVLGAGAATATVVIPPNSINSGMIINGEVKTLDIKDGAVKSNDIRDGNVTRDDLAPALATQFARVAYVSGVPQLTAQSGGLAFVSEPFTGAVRIAFPQDMTNCAITATAVTGGATTSIRRSTTGAANEIVVVGFDVNGTTIETNFDLMGQCVGVTV